MSKNEKLRNYFDFLEEELEQNRKGRIAEDQKLIIQEKVWKDTTRILGIFMGLAVVVFIVMQMRFPSSNNLMGPGILGAVTIIAIIGRAIKKSDISLESV